MKRSTCDFMLKITNKAEMTREQIEQELYSKYTYKPQINQLSKLMAVDRSPTQLYESSRDKTTLNQTVHNELNEKKLKEWTFKPKINANYPEVKSEYTNKDELKAKLQEKARQRRMKGDQERMDREYEELKYWTFKPTINDGFPQSHNEVVVVRGLARHMELAELAQKKTQDQIEREIQVFGLGHKFAPNVNFSEIQSIEDPLDVFK